MSGSNKLSPSAIINSCLSQVITTKLVTMVLCIIDGKGDCFSNPLDKLNAIKRYVLALIVGIASFLQNKLPCVLAGFSPTIAYSMIIIIAFLFIYVVFTFIKFMIKNKKSKKAIVDPDESDETDVSEKICDSE